LRNDFSCAEDADQSLQMLAESNDATLAIRTTVEGWL
jgi:hypothetical protein